MTNRDPLHEPLLSEPIIPTNISFADYELADENDSEYDEEAGNAFTTPEPPEGFIYQYKRYSVKGAPDQDHYTYLLRRGWRPVPSKRHPFIMTPGHPSDAAIIKRGMILMEIPLDRHAARVAKSNSDATKQVREKEAQLSNTPEKNLPRTGVKLGKEYLPHVIEE